MKLPYWLVVTASRWAATLGDIPHSGSVPQRYRISAKSWLGCSVDLVFLESMIRTLQTFQIADTVYMDSQAFAQRVWWLKGVQDRSTHSEATAARANGTCIRNDPPKTRQAEYTPPHPPPTKKNTHPLLGFSKQGSCKKDTCTKDASPPNLQKQPHKLLVAHRPATGGSPYQFSLGLG